MKKRPSFPEPTIRSRPLYGNTTGVTFMSRSRLKSHSAFDGVYQSFSFSSFGVSATTEFAYRGEQVKRLPLHPRLARMLIAAGGARQMAQACALLSERHLLPPRTAATTSDLLSAIDDWRSMPPHVQRAATVIESTIQSTLSTQQSSISREADFRRAVLAGYPDRVAQRRARHSAEVLLATGTGATIARESGVREG